MDFLRRLSTPALHRLLRKTQADARRWDSVRKWMLARGCPHTDPDYKAVCEMVKGAERVVESAFCELGYRRGPVVKP